MKNFEIEEIIEEIDATEGLRVEVRDLGETSIGLPLEERCYYDGSQLVRVETDVPNSVGGYETRVESYPH